MKRLLLLLCLLSIPLFSSADEPNETRFTDKLNDTTLTYTYSGGWKFSIKYSSAGVSYTMHNYKTPWSENYPYKAIEISDGVYFTSWFDGGRKDYVTHLINLNTKRLYGSVLMANGKIHFEQAIINNVE